MKRESVSLANSGNLVSRDGKFAAWSSRRFGGVQPGMLEALGRVLRETREGCDVSQLDVALAAGVSQAVISRLENGKRWPEQHVEEIVDAYSTECDVNRVELWDRAVALTRPG